MILGILIDNWFQILLFVYCTCFLHMQIILSNLKIKINMWHDMMSMLKLIKTKGSSQCWLLSPPTPFWWFPKILPLFQYFPNSLHSKKILNCAVKLARCATLYSSLKKFFSGDENLESAIQILNRRLRLANWQSRWLLSTSSPAHRVLNHNKVTLEYISPKWKFEFSSIHEMAWKSD